MKAILSSRLFVCGLAVAFTLGACANLGNGPSGTNPIAQSSHRPGVLPTQDDRNAREVAGNTVGGANGEEYRVPTGSLIPRKYHRRGYTTDDQDPRFVYDQNDIRLQSAENVSDSLRTVPGISVRGTR